MAEIQEKQRTSSTDIKNKERKNSPLFYLLNFPVIISNKNSQRTYDEKKD